MIRSRLLRERSVREEGYMSQPIRVEGWAYTLGARVSLRLRFRSHNRYARRAGEGRCYNPSSQVIKLEGVSPPREESGAAHTEVVLTGLVPERAALGTYECRSVQGLTGDRNWASSLKTPISTSAWSNTPSTPKEGESFWDLSQRRGRKA